MGKIAVFTDKTGKMCNFYNCQHFDIYVKEDHYKLVKSKDFEAIVPSSLNKIRQEVNRIIELLDDCKVAAFGEIFGIPFSAFDMAGFSIFQLEKISDDVLDGVFSDIEEAKNAMKEMDEMIKKATPIETDTSGVFIVDMVRVQEANPEMSTKRVLLPFFESTPFMELKILCVHIPPWIERDGRFDVSSEQTEKGLVATVTYKKC